ncbi:MAG: 50S ribosomal protein L11 [Candidatus Pacearchaeota archaeon]
MQIKLLVEGGNLTPNPGLSQKIGPLGLNVGQLIQKVNEATQEFKGLKVPVELEIDTDNNIEVNVFSPPVSELLKKELKIEKASGAQEKVKVANASIEQIISVAKTKLPNLLSKDLRAATKSVVGTCGSLGVLIESKESTDVQKEIDEGKYDKQINEEITETPADKKAELEDFISKLKSKQDILIKQEQAAKEAEAEKEAEKTEEKPATETAEKKPEEKK